jgi:hypothetical protein
VLQLFSPLPYLTRSLVSKEHTFLTVDYDVSGTHVVYHTPGSQDGATPLFKASHKGHASVIEELLKYKPSLGLLPVSNTLNTRESLRSSPEEPSKLASTLVMLHAHTRFILTKHLSQDSQSLG